MSKQSLIVQIMADASRYTRGLGQAASATGRFGASARAELSRLKSFATSLHGQLAGLGIGVGLAKMSKDTAVFERDMRQLQVNIGATREEMEAWRKEAFENQKRYGTLVSDQKELADSLQAAGLDLDAVRAAAEPVSKTLAVAKTNADALGKGDLYTARLTLDITPAMRARIKVSAFTQGVTVADLLRGLLEREFPEHRRENTP